MTCLSRLDEKMICMSPRRTKAASVFIYQFIIVRQLIGAATLFLFLVTVTSLSGE